MGVNIADLLESKEIELDELRDKIIAVDAHLFLYQFLTTIRQRDGSLLMDSKGRVTSHLSGLFYRTIKLAEYGMRQAYVFDGKAPALKEKERTRRKVHKEDAAQKYEKAVAEENIDNMKRYAAQTTRLTSEMIAEAKHLLHAMGIPIIEAPSEGEAQAAYMVKTGKAYAVASQDADALLFGCPRLVRNLSFAGKRKKANKLAFEAVKPEMVTLTETLTHLGLSQEQLIVLGILVGTDFNHGGIHGIGPKNAVKLLHKFGSDFEMLFDEVKWKDQFDTPWQEIYQIFREIPVSDDVRLEWRSVDDEGVRKILIDEHSFERERVDSILGHFKMEQKKKTQKGLGDYF